MSSDPLIIVAPNGARRTQADHPALPMTPDELAQTAQLCLDEGCGMIHMHARRADGRHSLELDDNRRTYDAVKAQVGEQMIVQMTTESVGLYAPADQMKLIRTLKPEAASFGLLELIPSIDAESEAQHFFHWVREQEILAQYILYSAEHVKYYLSLRERGILPEDYHHLLFVLGRYTQGQQSRPEDLKPFLEHTGQVGGVRWAVCAFGQQEQACLIEAARQGGDVRIGFENNLLTQKGQLAADNHSQVRNLASELASEGKHPLGAQEFKQRLIESIGNLTSID